MLRMGYTSACGFGSLHRLDVALRNAINAGRVPGPRLLASGRGITGTSGLVDWHPTHWKIGMDGMALKADSPFEMGRAVREIRKEGADIVKIFLDGENMTPQSLPSDITFSLEEVMACGEEARARNVRVVTHSRSAEAVKMALKAGFFAIGHANFLDDEAIDLMRKSPQPVFVGPAIGFDMGLYENGTPFGFDPVRLDKLGYGAEIESTKKNVRRMREAGVRVLPGGDYGFGWTPHGTYAKDLQYFVELFGYTPFDALIAATRDAGEMVGFGGGRVGTLEAGKLADLILVAGDPTVDITVLQERSKIVAVMKGGKFYHYALDSQSLRGLPFARSTGFGRDAESLEVVKGHFRSCASDLVTTASVTLDRSVNNLATVSKSVTVKFPGCTADVDLDANVGDADRQVILATMGSAIGDPNWNPEADLDHDGNVDADDLLILESQRGPCAATHALPVWKKDEGERRLT